MFSTMSPSPSTSKRVLKIHNTIALFNSTKEEPNSCAKNQNKNKN